MTNGNSQQGYNIRFNNCVVIDVIKTRFVFQTFNCVLKNKNNLIFNYLSMKLFFRYLIFKLESDGQDLAMNL